MVKMTKILVAVSIATGVTLGAGCLTRPVVSENPTTKTSFSAQVKQQSIDKVDLLFAIDNSGSMGDKQDLLALAVPVLVNRLLVPNCVVTATTGTGSTCKTAADCTGTLGAGAQCDVTGNSGNGQCFVKNDGQLCASIPGTKVEFDAVHDLHVGIVSSSLGDATPDGQTCPVQTNDSTHENDKGHLLNRTLTSAGPPAVEGSIANAKPVDNNGGNFLAWLPSSNSKNANKPAPNVTPYTQDTQATQFVADFQSLVSGVQQHGCGLESQLESWYRFLIAPDPYDSITFSSGSPPQAQLTGVDATLLKMRYDFLRPDSLVAIIQLTDEEDSWSDPLWFQGFGWTSRTSSTNQLGGPGQGAGPRGTSECDVPVDVNNPTTTGPNDPNCVSCEFATGTNAKPNGDLIANDPNCQACAPGATTCTTKGWYTPAAQSVPITAADGLNVRYGNQYMRQRYGYDNQPAIQRYIDGLRLPNVPDSAHENHDASNYGSVSRNCVNPLFAAQLPDGSDTSSGALCNLTPGSRTPDLVFYALIGGVPNQLVQDANGNFKSDLSTADWTAILGKDPDHYIFDGIDPHMIESIAPRSGLPAPGTTYNLGSDPENGREWNTLTSGATIDLQFACTFDLPQPKDCSLAVNTGACDCSNTAATAPDGPPLCSVATRTSQIKGKAYPTIRELRVAKGLGAQSVVASLCAQNVTGNNTDPTFGYNPAMQAIVNRLKNALSGQCLPQALSPAADGTIPCLILVEYAPGNQAAGCTDPGMSQPSADVIARFDAEYLAALPDGGAGVTPPVVCQFKQLIQGTDYQGNTCEGAAGANGWCYVSGSQNTGGCAQAIKFGSAGPPGGTTINLQCIEQSGAGDAGATE